MENEVDLYFIKNVGQSFTIVLIGLGFPILYKILSYVKVWKIGEYFKNRIKQEWEYNGYFDLLWTVYIYAAAGVFLQFFKYEIYDNISYLNYVMHVVTFFVIVLSPLGVYFIIYKGESIKYNSLLNEKFDILIGGINIVKQDFSENINLKRKYQAKYNKYCNAILYARKLVFIILIVNVYDYPYTQLSLITL